MWITRHLDSPKKGPSHGALWRREGRGGGSVTSSAHVFKRWGEESSKPERDRRLALTGHPSGPQRTAGVGGGTVKKEMKPIRDPDQKKGPKSRSNQIWILY